MEGLLLIAPIILLQRRWKTRDVSQWLQRCLSDSKGYSIWACLWCLVWFGPKFERLSATWEQHAIYRGLLGMGEDVSLSAIDMINSCQLCIYMCINNWEIQLSVCLTDTTESVVTSRRSFYVKFYVKLNLCLSVAIWLALLQNRLQIFFNSEISRYLSPTGLLLSWFWGCPWWNKAARQIVLGVLILVCTRIFYYI